ncbi:MAG: hypothetical protein LBL46_01945 [Rickettsiales bacterium]|jgi:hypothetical protein|nr:hypothetical protein [Rickettsiales bacterium]
MQNIIAQYLKLPGTVVSLNGDWGSGKTYLWDNNQNPRDTVRYKLNKLRKKTIYISLFGKASVSELKKDILGKSILTKGPVFEFTSAFALLFLLTSIISIFAFQIIDAYALHKTWIIFTALLVSSVVVLLFHNHILRYFAHKTLGFDHDNIDYAQILNSNKIIFCFDDLERLSVNSNIEEFMGFFENLKQNNFSMLLISNDDEQSKKHADNWKEFKEKVVSVSLVHNSDSVLESIIKTNDLTKHERQFITETYQNLHIAKQQPEKYREDARDNIQRFANNFRFFSKLLQNFQKVRRITFGYENLDDNTIGNLLSYITYIFVKSELGVLEKHIPTKNDLLQFFYDRLLGADTKNALKPFGYVFTTNKSFGLVPFPVIYDFLTRNNFDYERFLREHTSKPLSETEKYVLFLGHWLDYRRPQQRRIVAKIERLMRNDELPFSSFENMKQVLNKYSVFCSYIEKNLTYETSGWLLQKIKNLIYKNEVSLSFLGEHRVYGSLLQNISDDNGLFRINKNFINKNFEQILLSYWLNKINAASDFLQELTDHLPGDENGYYKSLCLYILLEDKNKQLQVFNLRDTNYKKWQNITNLIKVKLPYYYTNSMLVAKIKEMMDDKNDAKKTAELFWSALSENINGLKKLPDAGLSEELTAKNFFEDKY